MKALDAIAAVRQNLSDTARAYAAFFFLDSPLAGALLIAATFVYPNTGASGLLAALVGMALARLFRFPVARNSVYILNSLLVGLSLGAFYRLDANLAALIIAGAALAVFASAALADLFWRQERLPVLVIPFLLVTAVTALVAKEFNETMPFVAHNQFAPPWLPAGVDAFLSMLGATFFSVHPVAGALVLAVMVWRSRYLALLAVAAVLVGQLGFRVLGVTPQPMLLAGAGFNLVLTAIAIGGIFTVPGIASFLTAMLAVVLTGLLLIACQDLLFVYGLPLIALPYIGVTLLFLLALRTRLSVAPPWLVTQPGMPEQNYESARLARMRNGDVNSVPLLLPVFGRWEVYQGFDGEHTHQPPWQHALDFHITEGGKSYSGQGDALEEFYCFGLPVLSPVHGQVVRVCDHLADNPPGDVDTKNNWGNFVLIRLDSGLHVLLAHLRQHSARVKEGEWIVPGKALASCGNSGRSPQPHLHLQVQRNAQLGSATEAFHLCSLLRHKTDGGSEYLVNARPQAGDTLEAAVVDPRLATPLHLPVGRQFTYRVEGDGLPPATLRHLQVELTLLGQFRLASDICASAAFEEKNGVLAFYDRQGPADILLDIWLLACGLTPLSENAHRWRDMPSAQLLPLDLPRRLLLKARHPLGCGLNSRYQREYIADEGLWRQRGQHELRLGARVVRADTECRIDPELGCRTLTCNFGARQWRAQLTELGLAGDGGVPGWRISGSDGPIQNPKPKTSGGFVMKKARLPHTRLVIACALCNTVFALTASAAAQTTGPWEMRAAAQTVYGNYNDADLRDELFGAGFFLGGDYLDKGGFTVGYTYTEVKGKGSGPGTFDTLKENSAYLSGKFHVYSDGLAGRVTWRLDGYFINDDSSGNNNNGQGSGNSGGGTNSAADADIGVANPIVSFLRNDKTLGFDLGYAYSSYDYDGGNDFQAHQLTPTIGFAFDGLSNWVQLRGYYIHLSDDDINDGNNDTVALEAKLTHWFGPSGPLGLHSVGLSGMLGERFLAVDSDAAVVYTLADEQQGSVGLNGVWELGKQTSLMLQGGYEQYENQVISNDYDSTYIYLNLSHKW